MTKQEKQLLIQDICARLPFGVIVQYKKKTFAPYSEYTVDAKVEIDEMLQHRLKLLDFKPYLRPMSSMTDKEREYLQTLHNIISDENYGDGFSPAAWEAILDFNNYCREHHLDNGGLITLGLALEAPEGMYNKKIN